MNHAPSDIRAVESDDGIRGLFPLMRQLRPNLTSADEFLGRCRRQATEGYRLLALFEAGQPRALAGYRLQENLIHGRFLYLDDLVTETSARSCGYGETLIAHLRDRVREADCARLVLDTPLSNALGHRFYFRCGMLATSLRFAVEA
ncbi:GNAT family N-acetyltransferase [Alloalcanivorax sp. C16-2]|uniref:GNAT family N-acetyltransferase n=1 Tax=Alloalcanivorax sp. C16-2 TaxID=3390052 RepID=UPI00397115E0